MPEKMTRRSRVLLLENINPIARDLLLKAGFDVELVKNSFSETELIKKLKDCDALGIRSKTQITQRVLEENPHLHTVGCFCVGTNQVDLFAAKAHGMPVFNAPYSNTRSVAELAISNVISLARKIGTRNIELHQGKWNKESEGCFEVRGKTLGIIGYGNVGSQTSMLAEAIGMRVVFYDILDKLSLGNAKPMSSMTALLEEADFVTLHVPETPLTINMIGPDELAAMKPGSYLLNSSRGSIVDIEALCKVLKNGHISGAAIDVFPEEPEAKVAEFKTPLADFGNVILTPHIGGATEEAQISIGKEVANTLIRFLKQGTTTLSVNFPKAETAAIQGKSRILTVHRNVPGVLSTINKVVSDTGANILAQHLATDSDIGYLIMDLDIDFPADAVAKINAAKNMIRTRLIR